jgi:drug/metabolite transporter (DMT)-like permease
MNPYRLHAYLFLLVVAVIWGVAGVVIKFTLGGLDPLVFLAYRFAISAVVSSITSLIFGFRLPKDKKIIGLALFYGFLTSTVGLGLLFFGYDETSAIDATLISATGPIFISAGGLIFLKEHVTFREKLGMTIAFLGTAITILEPVLRNTNGPAGLTGNLLVFASILVGVATAIFAKILLRNELDPAMATNISFWVGFLTLAPVAAIVHSPSGIIEQIQTAPLVFHFGVLFMALISGNLAYTLWHKAQKTIEVGEVSVFAYLYPIFATPLAVVWLKEKITTPFMVGAVILTIGVVIAEYKKSRYNKAS